MRARTRRLWTVGVAAVLIVAAALLAIFALRLNADLFYTPEKLAERGGPELGLSGKVGGFVEPGSITFGEGAEMTFRVIDDSPHVIVVRYEGVTPDLFREASGVVATGTFDGEGVFEATNLLAKHDENYVPRELKGIEGPAS